jgi:P4 family phage/plasmid primase-like protien
MFTIQASKNQVNVHPQSSEKEYAVAKRAFPAHVTQLAEWLKAVDPESAIIQIDESNNKKPAFQHSKEHVWTRESYTTKPPTLNWGILVNDIVVIDCDNQEASAFLMEEFPNDFNEQSIRETTKRGMHWYFKRPNWLYGQDGIIPKVDVKTLARTGTRALVSCAPSEGKTWVFAPWDGELRHMTSELLSWLEMRVNPGRAKTSIYELIFGGRHSKENVSTATVRKIVANVGANRADEYGSWLHGVWAIASTALDSNWEEAETVDIMDLFSKRSIHYVPNANDKFYREAMVKNHEFSVGTLWFWLKEDAPKVFEELQNLSLNKLLDAAETGTDVDIALVVERMIGSKYKCCINELGTSEHYRFVTHQWKREPKWPSVWESLHTIVASAFLKRANFWGSMSVNSTNEYDSEKATLRAGKLRNIATTLKDHAKRNRIFAEFEKLCTVPYDEFCTLLDSHPHLIGFANGVFDLRKNEFRNGVPEDMITYSTGYKWNPSADKYIQKRILAFLQSIMPNAEMVTYMLQRFAYLLSGTKKFQDSNLSFWVGTGANGKGCCKSLIMKALGDYAYEADASLISTKRTDSSRASPELIKTKGKRVVLCSEPDSDAPINTSQIKGWTGGDQIQARQLYRTSDEFLPQFGLIVLMNNMPLLSDVDAGFARRLDVVDFAYKFVDAPKLANEKQIDFDLDQYFKTDVRYAQQFMLMLVNATSQIVDGIPKPQEVLAATNEYLCDNDKVRAFISENVEKTNQKSDLIKSSDMYTKFKRSLLFNGKNDTWFKGQMKNNGYVAEKKTTRGEACMCIVYFGCKWVNEDLDEDDA